MTARTDHADGADHLLPLDVVEVGGRLVVPDLHRPVAAVIEDGAVVRWLKWPSAPLPERAVEEAEAWPTTEGVWVVYSSDGIDGGSRTAVHLDPDRVGAAVDLGDRRVVGADSGGLWLADPRDASEWMAGNTEDDPASFAAADLPWAEVEPFWPDPETWTEPEPEAEDSEDFEASVDPDDHDATEEQWTIGFADWPDDSDGPVGPGEDEADADGSDDPGPPSPTPPTDVERIAPDGRRTTIRVDHLVERVSVEGDTMTLRFHRTGPDLVLAEAGGRDVVYRPREVAVDVSTGFPASVDTDALDSSPLADAAEDDAADLEWERSIDEREARRAPWIERLDLESVDGTRWPLWDRDTARRESSVARLVEQFSHLDAPAITWTRGVDGARRIRSEYREVRVEIDGTFPDTAVVVSFEHTAVPFLRLRRRYRVFDDTGRPVNHGYVGVYLEEDVTTGHIPPRRDAVDGVLDI